MSRWRNEDSNHPIAKLLLKKGYVQFEYGGSQIKNEYSGWWIESKKHKDLDGKFLGQTLRDVVWALKNTNEIPNIL